MLFKDHNDPNDSIHHDRVKLSTADDYYENQEIFSISIFFFIVFFYLLGMGLKLDCTSRIPLTFTSK